MTNADVIRAPWTERQVENLRLRQGALHPYTCNGYEGVVHKTVNLEPRPGGLRCPVCSYDQGWAHAKDVLFREWWKET